MLNSCGGSSRNKTYVPLCWPSSQLQKTGSKLRSETMANQIQTVHNPLQRMLTGTETLHFLNHWKTSFRTYYRRDTYFKAFLLPNASWNSLAQNYGQSEDIIGTSTTRSAVDKCEDLKDFLNTLSGYLPFPYLTEKIVSGSRNLQNVCDTIYDHYLIMLRLN